VIFLRDFSPRFSHKEISADNNDDAKRRDQPPCAVDANPKGVCGVVTC